MNMRPCCAAADEYVTSCTLGSALSTAATRALQILQRRRGDVFDASVFTWIWPRSLGEESFRNFA